VLSLSLLAPYLFHLSNSFLVCLVFTCLWVACLGSAWGILWSAFRWTCPCQISCLFLTSSVTVCVTSIISLVRSLVILSLLDLLAARLRGPFLLLSMSFPFFLSMAVLRNCRLLYFQGSYFRFIYLLNAWGRGSSNKTLNGRRQIGIESPMSHLGVYCLSC
jgi:hypothetical protein